MEKRIVSFLPSATEILYELGAGDQIVGVTHECNFPDDTKRKPRVIRASFDPSQMDSKEIDSRVIQLMQSKEDIYTIDEQVLKKANPDLIIAQGLCEVCSPFTKEVSKAVSILNDKPDVVILDPHNLDDILVSVMDVAKKINKTKQAEIVIMSLQKRIDHVKNKLVKFRPKVLCVEWLDPLFTAGHWIPQMVKMAGGINGISVDESSRRMGIDEVKRFDPDIVILMPCGFGIQRIREEYTSLVASKEWRSLGAVQNNQVYAVDANSYFSKPSPRTVTGLEILAKIIHPENFADLVVPKDSFVKI